MLFPQPPCFHPKNLKSSHPVNLRWMASVSHNVNLHNVAFHFLFVSRGADGRSLWSFSKLLGVVFVFMCVSYFNKSSSGANNDPRPRAVCFLFHKLEKLAMSMLGVGHVIRFLNHNTTSCTDIQRRRGFFRMSCFDF